jgi:hypothetical protein
LHYHSSMGMDIACAFSTAGSTDAFSDAYTWSSFSFTPAFVFGEVRSPAWMFITSNGHAYRLVRSGSGAPIRVKHEVIFYTYSSL